MGAMGAPHFTTSSHSPSFVCSIKVQELPPISRTILLKIGTLVRLRQENSTRLHQRHRTSRFIPNNTARSHCLPVHIERPYSNRASPSRASNKCASILTSTLPINPIPVRATESGDQKQPILNLKCHNARGNIGRSNCRRRLRTHQLSHFQRGFVRKIYGMEGWSWLDSRRCNGSYFSPQDRCG